MQTPGSGNENVKQFLFEFATLFAIINPYGLTFVFLERTLGLGEADRARVARSVAIYAFAVLVTSLLLGAVVLSFFGVSIPALRIAGGLVVAHSGWVLLNQAPAGEHGGSRSTANLQAVLGEAFYPLTVPLTAGPGTIATAITLAASHEQTERFHLAQLVSILVAAVVSLVILHAYARVSRLARLVGPEGTRVITRLSAFLLLCVGVQIILTGVTEAVRLAGM